jgi:lysophospholipase L1-like esterase
MRLKTRIKLIKKKYRKKIKFSSLLFKKLLVSLFSIICVLLLLEIACRISYPLYENYNTEMWRYASEIKQKSDNLLLGHEHIQNKSGYYYGTKIEINNMGLRSDSSLTNFNFLNNSINKDINATNKNYNIMFVGDSITLGWGVDFNKSFPYLIKNKLEKENMLRNYSINIFNLGVGNYNIDSYLESIKKYSFLEPDLIVVSLYINDLEKKSYPKDNLKILKKSYLYGFLSDKLINLDFKNNGNYIEYYNNMYADNELVKNFNNKIISIKKESKDLDSKLIIINIPELHDLKNYKFEKSQNLFLNISRNNNITYYDCFDFINDSISKSSFLWVSKEDVHPNELGHKLISESAYNPILVKIIEK